jgi:PAS domain S-box-containing protein
MQQFLQAGAWQGEVIQPNRNGDRRYILSSVTLLRDEADEPVGAVAVNRDITERKAAEERLRELLEQVRLAIDSAQLGLWELDLATNYLQWNDLQLTMYGISREEFETDLDGWRNRVHPEDKDYADGRLGEVFEGHPVFDVPFRVIRPSGEIRHINASATPIFNDAGEIVKLIGINMDVTETHVRENALRESEVRLLQRNQFIETILDNLPIGLAVNNIDKGTATYTNAKFEEIYGWPRKKISDIEQFFQCVYPDPEYRQQIQAQIMDDIASGDPERMSWEEIKITTEHGEKRIVSAKNIPIYNQNFMISTVQDITARSLAEKQIKRTELLLKGMSRIAKIGGWELDLVTMEPYFTEETFHIYELPPTKPPKLEDGISYYPPEYRSLVEKVVQEAIEKKLPYDIEVPFITAKGRHIWVRTQGRVYTEEGKAVRLYGSIQDISERKQAEQKLQVYAQRLETLHQIDRAILAQDSPERIAEVTINHLAQLISCDRISAGLFDETGETATVLAAHVAGATQLGQGMRVSIHDHDGIMSELRQGKTRMFPDLNQFAGRAPTIDALLHDGLRSYMMVPLIAGSRLVGSLSLGSTDTNQFDESHESLVREVADQLAIALHQAYLHKAEKDQRVLAETLQQTAVTLVGSLSLEETLDTILNQLALVVPYDLAQVMLIQDEMLMVGARQGALVKDLLVETERPYTQIPLLYQSLQSGKPFVLTASQIKENHLHLPGMAPELSTWVGIPLIARDIAVGFLTVGQVNAQYLPQEISAVTAFGQQAALAIEKATILLELEKSLNALRETQAHLVRAARLSAIGETAAGVAHQINNPLTTVIIDSHLLLKNLPPSHPARHSADAIHQAALRAANVVERLLDFSRTQPTTKSPTNISDSIKESLTILSAQLPKNIRLEVALPTDLPPVTASPEHLQDVWLNLLLNARDAVMQVDQGIIQVRISHNTTYDKIEVSIQDNGIGMSYTQQQQIFNPFFTTKDRGTGLGLSVCQDIIVHHDGEIRVSSVEGEGSKFTVILPVQPT